MHLWRISDYRTLSGQGGVRASARWHTAGHPIVYLAETPAGSLLEVLVHLELDEPGLPPRYTLLQVNVPDALSIENLAHTGDKVWKSALSGSRRLGDRWLRKNGSALARVPSSLVPHTWNYLLNPLHPDASQVQIASSMTGEFDPRLLSRRQAT